MRLLDVVQNALEGDAVSQCQKYGDTEPSCRSARFHVTMPKSGQHLKYSWRRPATPWTPQVSETPSLATPPPLTPSPRTSLPGTPQGPMSFSRAVTPQPEVSAREQTMQANKQHLAQWFRELDKTGAGVITRRELILALRRHPEFVSAIGATPAPGCETEVRPKGDVGAPGGAWERQQVRHLARSVESDCGGGISWAGFLSFFRRAGLLLEYRVEEELINQPLCEQLAGHVTLATEVEALAVGKDDAIATEIRTGIGASAEARYRSRRRATSLDTTGAVVVPEGQDDLYSLQPLEVSLGDLSERGLFGVA